MSTFSFDAINANPEAESCDARFHVSEFHKSNSVTHYSEKNNRYFSLPLKEKVENNVSGLLIV